jgi:hypothetical protein
MASLVKREEKAALPAIWEPGVKWQIVLQAPIDITKPLQPADARVWDIDYFHALAHPNIIPHLVGFPPFPLPLADYQLSQVCRHGYGPSMFFF